jgi:hypothetical protein
MKYYYNTQNAYWFFHDGKSFDGEVVEVTEAEFEEGRYWERQIHEYRLQADCVYEGEVCLLVEGVLIPVGVLGTLDSEEDRVRVFAKIRDQLLEREQWYEDFYGKCQREFDLSWKCRCKRGEFTAWKGSFVFTRGFGGMWKMKYSWKYSVAFMIKDLHVTAEGEDVQDLIRMVG